MYSWLYQVGVSRCNPRTFRQKGPLSYCANASKIARLLHPCCYFNIGSGARSVPRTLTLRCRKAKTSREENRRNKFADLVDGGFHRNRCPLLASSSGQSV